MLPEKELRLQAKRTRPRDCLLVRHVRVEQQRTQLLENPGLHGTGKPLLHVFGYRQVVLQRFLARCAHKLPKILHVLRLPFCHCTPAYARMAAKPGAGRFFAANAAAFLQNAHTLAKIIS